MREPEPGGTGMLVTCRRWEWLSPVTAVVSRSSSSPREGAAAAPGRAHPSTGKSWECRRAARSWCLFPKCHWLTEARGYALLEFPVVQGPQVTMRHRWAWAAVCCSWGDRPSVAPELSEEGDWPRGTAGVRPQPRPISLHQTTSNCHFVGHRRLNNGSPTWFDLQHMSTPGGGHPRGGITNTHQKFHSIPKSSWKGPREPVLAVHLCRVQQDLGAEQEDGDEDGAFPRAGTGQTRPRPVLTCLPPEPGEGQPSLIRPPVHWVTPPGLGNSG